MYAKTRGTRIVIGKAMTPNLMVTHVLLATSGSFTSRRQLASPTKVVGSALVRLKSVRENHSDAAIGRAVNSTKPMIQGETKTSPTRP